MYRFYLVTLSVLAASCSKMASDEPKTHGVPSFYYWQSELRDFKWDDSTFQALNVGKIYYRFFDVDWSDQAQAAVPVSPLDTWTYYRSKPSGPVVPVVFITNETFKNLSESQSEDLANHVHRKVMGQMREFLVGGVEYELYPDEWPPRDPYRVRSRNFDEQKKYDSIYYFKMKEFREIQFDCDWTKSTGSKYFAFLNAAKKLFKDQLVTSTIRLYQYKYPDEAGLPPVARGMLMCYNAGDVRDIQTKNSIFDKKEIMSYLSESQYPIPLDYALPVFDWALLYNEGEFKNILSTSVLRDEYQTYLDYRDSSHARVTDDFVYGHTKNSLYIRRGDEIRFEEPSMEDVQEVAAWLSDHKNNKEAILSIYHLNNHDLKEHSKAIEAIFNSF